MVAKLRDVLLSDPGQRLAQFGFEADPGRVEKTDRTLVVYHYTHRDRLQVITGIDGGLSARLPVGDPCPPEIGGHFKVEGFLEPLPRWLKESPYSGDLGWDLFRSDVGDVLLRVELPADFGGVYVADYAHVLERKHATHRGRTVLGLGYDCSNGRDCTRAFAYSYIPIQGYDGGHVAPVVQMVREGPGLTIPSRFVSLSTTQPVMDGVQGN